MLSNGILMKQQIHKSFQKSVAVLILAAIAISTIVIKPSANYEVSAFLIGLPILLAGVISIFGTIDALECIRAPNCWKKTVAFMVNFAMVTVLFIVIITNIEDILQTVWYR